MTHTTETLRKIALAIFLLITVTPCLDAQKKELSQARTYIKSGKDFDKAEKLLSGLLKDSANRHNPKIYLLLYQAQKKQYDAGNEKLYMKQKYDTASMFNLTRNIYSTLTALDTLDATPDRKGRVKTEYRKKHAEEFSRMRPNLFYGGTFNVRKNDFATAYRFFEDYIGSASQPLFEGYDYTTTDRHMASAAYWATLCGQRLNNADMTLRYATLARKDTARLVRTLHYMADAYAAQKNDSLYLKTLKEGFHGFPTTPYFFPKLIDFYTAHSQLNQALALADTALINAPRNPMFLFAKSIVLLSLGRNDECISVSDTLIAINDTLPDAYLNAGTAYLNKAVVIEADTQLKNKKKSLKACYQKAQPYIERYRTLSPKAQDKWAPLLYRIYLNLNMGKQFDEIDKLLN